jgi:hypothetical protein
MPLGRKDMKEEERKKGKTETVERGNMKGKL